MPITKISSKWLRNSKLAPLGAAIGFLCIAMFSAKLFAFYVPGTFGACACKLANKDANAIFSFLRPTTKWCEPIINFCISTAQCPPIDYKYFYGAPICGPYEVTLGAVVPLLLGAIVFYAVKWVVVLAKNKSIRSN
jgi:hypothetical protein